jgi:hypothetical protein
MTLLLLCHPHNAYRDLPEASVGTAYRRMAIDDYDAMVEFDPVYDLFKEEPDYGEIVGKKDGRNLVVLVFHAQPMTRIGRMRQPVVSSSYLFNPQGDPEMLPDLDVVEVSAENRPITESTAAAEIREFYKLYGWHVKVMPKPDLPTRRVLSPSARGLGEIEIIDPTSLRELAAQEAGYDLERLYF